MAAASSAPGFDVFFSYNRRDRDQIYSAEAALRAANLRVFVDYRQLAPGGTWITELEKVISDASSVAVFVGANGLGRWQSREIQLALDLDKRVIPVLLPSLKDDPPLGFLRLLTRIDLRSESLARLSAAIRSEPEPGPAFPDVACPYRGLAFFREEDGDLYFGREAKVDELAAQLEQSHFVAVTGPSGAGKSSLLRAGLARRLHLDRAHSWEILTLVPNQEPLLELGRALAPLLYPEGDRVERSRSIARNLLSGAIPLLDYARELTGRAEGLRVLLMVDQFEQLFTGKREANEIEVFIREILDASERGSLSVVVAYRADFHGSMIAHNGLAGRLKSGHFILDSMRPEQLRAAIEKPALYVGRSIDASLTERLLLDAAAEPGNLPLLEFVLRQLWEMRQLTLQAYHDLGSLQGALSRYADSVYGKLSVAEQFAARRVFLKTIRVGESCQDTRRRAARAEIGESDWAVVPVLAANRLLVTGRIEEADCVEICHEALIRYWAELRTWLAADREFLLWRERLHTHMEEWRNDKSSLLSGQTLAKAEERLASRDSDLSAEERHYIQASIDWRDAESRKVRRIKRLTFACAVVAVLAIVWGWWAFAQNSILAAAANYELATIADSNVKVVEDYLLPEGSEESRAVVAGLILKASLKNFGAAPTEHETPKAALSRVKLFENLCKNFDNLNDLPDALSAANEEFAIAQHQEKTDGSNRDWLHYMVLAKEHLGKNWRMMNKLGEAETSLKQAIGFAEQLSAEHADASSKKELAHAHELLGDVFRDQSRFPEAFDQYRNSFALAPSAQETVDDGDLRNLAILHGKTADMLLSRGKFEDAARELESNLEISRSLANKFPKKGDLQHGVAVAHERFGFLRLRQGRWDDAADQYRQDLEAVDGLMKMDNKNVTWLTDQAFANEGLGDVLRLRPNKDLRAALKYYQGYLGIVNGLVNSDQTKSNAKLRRDVAVGYQRLGVAELEMGLKDKARADFGECVSHSNEVSDAFDVRNPDPQDVRGACQRQLDLIARKEQN